MLQRFDAEIEAGLLPEERFLLNIVYDSIRRWWCEIDPDRSECNIATDLDVLDADSHLICFELCRMGGRSRSLRIHITGTPVSLTVRLGWKLLYEVSMAIGGKHDSIRLGVERGLESAFMMWVNNRRRGELYRWLPWFGLFSRQKRRSTSTF